ncbi:MAG TPA: hypothetical protein V6D34_01770 [Candidatus Sericytochromatia bacterium]
MPKSRHGRYIFRGCAKAGSTALLLLAVGCTKPQSTQVELSVNVEPTNRPGVYTVSGSTNLPDESQIIVQGIRSLTPPTQVVSTREASNYAILDRQSTKASQGKWQATLKLWQVAPDGQYREAWQLSTAQLSRLNPSIEVAFIAVIDPVNQATALQQQLQSEGKKLEGANVRFTPDGQWYLQAQQTLAVTLPTGKTALPVVRQ